MTIEPIGMIHTPFTSLSGMPIQPAGARGVRGRIELRPEFAAGLSGLDGFSHIIVLYHFHQVPRVSLTVTPFLDDRPRGIFATRAPVRPNPLGLSLLSLLRVEGTLLEVEGVDVLDGTPLLDLKPYVPAFDQPVGPVRAGWLEQASGLSAAVRSDGRFAEKNP